jgi:hypothetical protein
MGWKITLRGPLCACPVYYFKRNIILRQISRYHSSKPAQSFLLHVRNALLFQMVITLTRRAEARKLPRLCNVLPRRVRIALALCRPNF